MAKKLAPLHPGEILWEEFMKPLKISQNRLGRELRVPPRRINQIVHGKRAITADTALRLSRFFGNSAEFWLGLQADYELDVARDASAATIEQEVSRYTESEYRLNLA
jgi:addiction module HigA family antidote